MFRAPTIKLLLVLCLAFQMWAGTALGGTVVCIRGLTSWCAVEERCCKNCGDHDGDAPAPHGDECPPDCSCCIHVPASERQSRVESREELSRAVAWAALPALDPISVALGRDPLSLRRGIPPPARQASPLAVGLSSTRLLV